MKICIVGVGLLGGSFALAVKSIFNNAEVIGIDHNPENIRKAKEIGIIDLSIDNTSELPSVDFLVLAIPVNAITSTLRKTLDKIKDETTVIDLGSTKEKICFSVIDHRRRKNFVAAHPIAGTENSGPEAAFRSLLKNKMMIICDKQHSGKDHLKKAVDLFKKLEMKIVYMSSNDHDKHIAYVSHLSHISSFALGLTVLEKEKNESSIFAMAGSGFSSTVRLAKSSPEMWSPIFLENGENVSTALGEYIEQLQEFKKIIDDQDAEASRDLMKKANEIRRVLIGIDKK